MTLFFEEKEGLNHFHKSLFPLEVVEHFGEQEQYSSLANNELKDFSCPVKSSITCTNKDLEKDPKVIQELIYKVYQFRGFKNNISHYFKSIFDLRASLPAGKAGNNDLQF